MVHPLDSSVSGWIVGGVWLGQCGACSVLMNGTATRSCVTPVSAVKGEITTLAAIYDATGVRIRRVPFRPERVLAVLKAAGV